MTSETAAQQRSHGWSARQTLAAVGVAAMIGGVGGAAIYAATESPAHTMGGGTQGVGGPMHGAPPAPGGPPPAPAQPGPTDAIHSEYVVRDRQPVNSCTDPEGERRTSDPLIGRRQERRRVHPDLRASARGRDERLAGAERHRHRRCHAHRLGGDPNQHRKRATAWELIRADCD